MFDEIEKDNEEVEQNESEKEEDGNGYSFIFRPFGILT